MSQLILEFPLPDGSATLDQTHLSIELGNGVRLTSSAPDWIQSIHQVKLQLVMEITGVPPDADTHKSPIR